MARAATAAFVALLVAVAVLPVRSYLTKPREVIASTPTAFTGATVPIALPQGAEACADEILFDADAEVARFGATAPAGSKAPALEIVARGNSEGEYRSAYESVARVKGGWSGSRLLDVPLEPPRQATFGTFCVNNRGDELIELVGNENGRAFSRPTLRINGEPSSDDLPLRFLEAEQSSLLSRAGRLMAHASTLRPFGAWWWWLLALAVAVLSPVAVMLAVRWALTADAARAARDPAPAGAWPSERLRRRANATPGWAIVAAAGALAVLWFFYWGFNTHVFQDDEDQYVYLSRALQDDFPAMLWDFEIYGRGLQRLEVWLLAIPSFLFDSPLSLVGGRFLNTVAFVSTAIPIFLMGRGMGLRPQWAALPAVVSIAVPWAVVTTAFLTENVAYPACLWVIWAIWRTATEPSPRGDLVALFLLVVAGTARSGLLLLAPVLPVVLIVAGMRCGAGGPLARLRSTLRNHVVLWIAVAIAALPLMLAPIGVEAADAITRRLAGGYGTQVGFDWALMQKMGSYFSRTVIGTGFFAAAVALPWLFVQLVRPRDHRRFAFGAVVVIAAAALLFSLAPAGPDERYILYLAPLILLPATLAVAHRELSPGGIAIASILLAALVLRVSWNPEQGPFGFFVSPVEMFYSRAVGLRLMNYFPGDVGDVLTVVAVGLGVVGVALGAALRWAPERLAGAPAAALVGVVVAVVPLQTHYTLTKYVNGAGSKSAAGLKERAFVDLAVPGGVNVGVFAEGVGLLPEFFPIWQEVQFYNEQIDTVHTLGPSTIPVPPGDASVPGVTYDERTGRLRSPVPLPEFLVVSTHFGSVGVRGEFIRAPAYVAAALVRVAQPAMLAWRSAGIPPYGALPENAEGVIRFYGAGLRAGAHCATLTLASPAERSAEWRLARGGQEARGLLEPGERRDVPVELPGLVARGYVDVSLAGDSLQVLAANVDHGC